MLKTTAALIRFFGICLILIGLVFLSPLTDLLPVDFSINFLKPFSSSPATSYYRVVPVEHSYWIEILMIASGTLVYVVGRYLRRYQ